MPYVDPSRRPILNESTVNQPAATSGGELNYSITQIVLNYLGPEPGYVNYNEVIGVLECVKQELYRRGIAPYEDTKIKQNGDIEWSQYQT